MWRLISWLWRVWTSDTQLWTRISRFIYRSFIASLNFEAFEIINLCNLHCSVRQVFKILLIFHFCVGEWLFDARISAPWMLRRTRVKPYRKFWSFSSWSKFGFCQMTSWLIRFQSNFEMNLVRNLLCDLKKRFSLWLSYS